MSLSVRGRLDIEKVKNSKDMPTEEGRGIGYYDDCLAKLANQEEDERLTETMDSLHLQRTRMLADTRHEQKSVDRTLRQLQNQKKLLRRATLENVISGVNRQLAFKSFQSIDETTESEIETEDPPPKNESKPTERLPTETSTSCPAFPGVPIPTDSSLSGYDTYWLRRRGVNPPLCARPASTKIFNETFTDEAKTNAYLSKRRLSRQKTAINLNGSNELDAPLKPKEEDVSRNKFRPRTSLGRDVQRRNSSSSSREARPHTAQVVGTRGRSRRELTQLMHIDAVTSSEREHRRKEWLEAKSKLKEEQDRVLRKKVISFLENIEGDRKKFLSDVNDCSANRPKLDLKAL